MALITGGGSGIGAALCKLIVDRGGRVCIVGRNIEPLKEIQKYAPEKIVTVVADVSRAEECEMMVNEANKKLEGGLTQLFNNVGMRGAFHPPNCYSSDNFDQVMNTNVKAAMIATVTAAKIDGFKAVVNISSIASMYPKISSISYATSKAALEMITKYNAMELAPRNIRVNAIVAGVVATERWQVVPGLLERTKKACPMNRSADPIEIAKVAYFLASDEASFITGACLPVDGGASLTTWLASPGINPLEILAKPTSDSDNKEKS